MGEIAANEVRVASDAGELAVHRPGEFGECLVLMARQAIGIGDLFFAKTSSQRKDKTSY